VSNTGTATVAPVEVTAQTTPMSFTGEKTAWYGFDRFDFLMDAANSAIKPFRAASDEGTGVHFQVEGQIRCVVVVPNEPAPGKPWSWRGRYFDHEPQAEVELLRRGFHIGFVQSDDIKHWEAWFTFLTERHGLSTKPAFVGMSGGGRNAFTWATTHPDQVSSIYADNPLITRESLLRLGELVERDVPLLHICGSLDPLNGNHTLPIESLYQQLGGRISVMIKDGTGHHPHSLRDPTPIADFIARSVEPAVPPPSFVGEKFTRSSFYSVANSYTEFPKEETYVTCRGAWFSKTYNRYEFKPEGATGTTNVVVPRKPASGRPWVLRADLVARDAVVDLALLQNGFHIVTAPRPRDPNITLMQEWQTLYRFLVDQGFSPKPVMEGAGGAASEVYAWAIANPDKVSCLYAENPILRLAMSNTQPLDHLAPLANAGVPLLHVCGSVDPWLETQTKVVQQRYQKLGGQITVIIKEGDGHYPLAPRDPQPVMEFILRSVPIQIRNN
jgi:pimeloyl-ACP methyl ester carboxylesterase